jgi:hypothetical protein
VATASDADGLASGKVSEGRSFVLAMVVILRLKAKANRGSLLVRMKFGASLDLTGRPLATPLRITHSFGHEILDCAVS